MKILYLTDYSGVGGGEKSLLYLSDYARKNGDNVLLANLFYGKLNKEADLLGIENTYLHKRKVNYRGWYKGIPIFFFNTIFRLFILIRKFKPEVIHINSSGRMLTSILAIHKFLNCRIYWTCHGGWERPFGFKKLLISKFIKKVFFVSNYVKEKSTFEKGKEVLTYLGVPTLNKLDRNRKKTSNQIIVAVIGRFQKIKNQKLILELLKQHPYSNIDFLFIGGAEFGSKKDENYRNELVALVNRLQLTNIKIFPYINNVFDNYPEIDFILVPSLFETFSLVTIEALVRGIPVIATENGGPKEILDNGKYGMLFDPTRVGSLKDALDRALNSSIDYSALIKRGEYFSIENYYKRVKEHYNE